MSEIIQLYSDKDKKIKAYPKTLANEVYMDDGITNISTEVDNKIKEVNSQLDNKVKELDGKINSKSSNEKVDNLQSQVNNLVISSGQDSSAEVIQSRGQFALLNDNLEMIKSEKYYDYDKTPLSLGYKKEIDFVFIQGTISTTTGMNTSSTTSCRVDDFYTSNGETLFIKLNGGTCRVFEYDSSCNHLKNTLYSADTYITLVNENKYRFTIRKADTTNITPFEAKIIGSFFTSNDTIDNIKTLNDKILSNKENLNGEKIDYSKTPMFWGCNKFLSCEWELGGITYTNGNNQNVSNCIRTPLLSSLELNEDIAFRNLNPSIYSVRIFKYTLDKSFVSYVGWIVDEEYTYKVEKGYLYRIVIYNTLGNIILSECNNIVKFFYDYDKIAILNNVTSKTLVDSLGHQGGLGGVYPKNTIENIKSCSEKGFTHCELDVFMSLDRVPIVSHDQFKTIYGTNERVDLSKTNYDDIVNYRFFEDPTIKIPNLYDFARECKLMGLNLALEFKGYDFTNTEMTKIVNFIKTQCLFEKAYFMAFSFSCLTKVRNIDENANVVCLFPSNPNLNDLTTSETFAEVRQLLTHQGRTSIYITFSNGIDLLYLNGLNDLGYHINMATTNDKDIIQTYCKYCTAVGSDKYTVEDCI